MNNYFFDDDGNETNNLISDINITPFVDIMLVLLIVFMITMPVLFTQMRLDFPTVSNAHHQNKEGIEPPIIRITLDKNGNYYLDDQLVTANDLQSYIHNELTTTEKKQNTIFALNAEIETKYGQLINLIDMIQKEGGTKIGYMQEIK